MDLDETIMDHDRFFFSFFLFYLGLIIHIRETMLIFFISNFVMRKCLKNENTLIQYLQDLLKMVSY